MKSLQIFDPALCCSTGVCGVDTEQALVDFAADVNWVKEQGCSIERINLAQEPLRFAQNSVVKSYLERSGAESLPLVLLDGEIALAGRYPTRAELLRWLKPTTSKLAIAEESTQTKCCSGDSCC